jgi:hypothetical protein
MRACDQERQRDAVAIGGMMVDRITESLLTQFSEENGLEKLSEDKRFEHLAAFSMLRRHYSRSFSTDDIVIGQGADTGIDAIAIIVNNVLVTDVDTLEELVEQNDYVDPTFVFVQAETSAGFTTAKIGQFSYGVVDFFAKTPKLPRCPEIVALAEIMDLIVGKYAAKLRPPKCYMYYVTTGIWTNDANLVARRNSAIDDVKALAIFKSPDFICVGATELHQAYRLTKSPITRTFLFDRRVEIPATEGVIQAVIGYLPFSEFKKLLVDDSGSEMLTSIFEDNVRDWQGWKTVNTGIMNTLQSENKSKFVLMNNGITIITSDLNRVGDTFTISNYQIVNGCQSSNVLFDQDQNGALDDSVTVPVRLIHTLDNGIKELITTATNSQTDIKPEQFASGKNFARGLEDFFATFADDFRLYYERRDGQYDRGSEQKARIIDAPTVIRSYASMFMEIPHTATRRYSAIRDQIGDQIFADGHKYAAYYYAAWAWYMLDTFFRNRSLDSKYKSARYHILMTVHLVIDSRPRPQPNSHEMERRAEAAIAVLHDYDKAGAVFAEALKIIDEVTGEKFERDHVRTEAITNAILLKFRPKAPAEGVRETSAV